MSVTGSFVHSSAASIRHRGRAASSNERAHTTRRPIVLALLLAVCGATGALAQSPVTGGRCRVAGGGVDRSQADLMMEFLDALAAGRRPVDAIDRILQSPGTRLVVQQMNLARRVSLDQYGAMLRALAAGGEFAIPPLDTTIRARRGVEGLGNAFSVLRWALERPDSLRHQLETLGRLDAAAYACARALGNLPRAVDLDVGIYLVMGGRAGAAALDSGRIYADVIVMDRAAARRGLSHAPGRVVLGFFAHEIHHLGLQRILEHTWAELTLSTPESYATRVLSELVLEGSATYLIDFDADLGSHLHDPGFDSLFASATALPAVVERVISRILAEGVTTDAEYDAVASPLIGNRSHATGALMLAAIDRAFGRERMMEVMADPRGLFATWAAAAPLDSSTAAYRPDAALAARLVGLGAAGRRH